MTSALSSPLVVWSRPVLRTAEAPPMTHSAPVSDDADQALIAASRRGDGSAFTELVARHKSRVFATASKYARNHHELDDLAQDIFIRVWKGLDSYRGEAPFEHWLMRLTVRACYDFLRRNRNRREREVSRDALLESGCLSVETAGAPEPEADTDALALLRRALTLLPPREHMIITLLELEERSVRDVATLTGWSETNVKVRAFRARQSLKKLIQRLGPQSPPTA